MRDFYESFYRLTATSTAHAEFCERVFGRNLCQHGFADMTQLDALIMALRLKSGDCVLDVGCGNGMIAEYVSDCTGAHLTGIDYIPTAIDQARERTTSKADRLAFRVGDINALDLAPESFDAIIAVDSIYFSDDYTRTLSEWKRALRPGGRMGIYFAHGQAGWVGNTPFDATTLMPEHTPLADALRANGLNYSATDFTPDDYRLALRRLEVLPELKARFEADDLGFVYENRIGDGNGIRQSIEDGLHRRYLYHVQLDAADA